MKRVLLLAFSAAFIVNCSGPAEPSESAEPATQESEPEMEAPAPEEPAGPVTLNVKAVGETMTEMKYEPTRLEVPAGAEVTIILENTAKAEAMIHNLVVIQPGKQTEVSQEGLAAGPDKDYIPESPFIIAHTSLAHPGETVEVKFKAPEEAGTYQFICTYPGHTAMKGIFLVK